MLELKKQNIKKLIVVLVNRNRKSSIFEISHASFKEKKSAKKTNKFLVHCFGLEDRIKFFKMLLVSFIITRSY